MNITKNTNKNVNERDHVLAVLQTVSALKHNYGARYLGKVLLGQKELGLKEEHQQLLTFGAMEEVHFDRVYKLIYYLIDQSYLKIVNTNFGTIDITEKGKDFLHEPHDIWLRPRDLRTNAYDIQLIIELRRIRQQLSKQEAKPPFRIFSDYTLQQIVRHKPTDVMSLKKLPGIGDYKGDRYGHLITQAVITLLEKKKADNKAKRFKRAYNYSHQEVKNLFEAGMNIDEIADKKQIKSTTVRAYLFDLHETGQINLLPWIEKEVDAQTLEKGKSYFERVQNARLKEAYEMLGLDYDTLRLCRLYVANMSSQHAELRYDYAS